ncbi:hypothetical protein AB0O67_36400 [Streptomyces sp. NPDC086077]|uniref:hypothetical protein n=1 Tax=Streptomyces sp. NPDC086077 TaxID=3154862 RepID=UPI0034459CD7
MKRTSEEPSLPETAAALANEVEGYLLVRSEVDDARREAEELCACLPWLTTAQAEDLTCHYVDKRLEFTRRVLRRSARRAEQLQQRYEARYAQLRLALLKGHAAAACAVLACASAVGAVLCIVVR